MALKIKNNIVFGILATNASLPHLGIGQTHLGSVFFPKTVQIKTDRKTFVYYCAILHRYRAVYAEEFRAQYCQLGNHGSRCDHYESGLYLHDSWRRLWQGEKTYTPLIALICIDSSFRRDVDFKFLSSICDVTLRK